MVYVNIIHIYEILTSLSMNIITIKYEGIQQQIPITCSQKLDPTKYTVMDPI